MVEDRKDFSTREWSRLRGGTGLKGGRRFSRPPAYYAEREQRRDEMLRFDHHTNGIDPDGPCMLHDGFSPAWQCPGCLHDSEMG